MKTIHILFSTIVLFFLGCQTDEPKIPAQNPTGSSLNDIDDAFKPYVEKFYLEMESRGNNLRDEPLSIIFVDELSGIQGNYCAYAYYFLGDLIEVVDSDLCWHGRTNTEKENLIFHELGHSLLSRPHKSGELPNGSPKSLMCTNTCNNYRVYNQYQTEQRAYYLNELLDRGVPAPDWASEKDFTETIATDYITNETIADWQTIIKNSDPAEIPYTFFIAETNTSSPPYALGISATAENSTNAYGYWYKDFPLSDFEYCSNLKVTADIITDGLTNGHTSLVVELYDFTGSLFHRYSKNIDTFNPGIGVYEDVETEAICLPLETAFVRVWFNLSSEIEAIAYMDDLSIDLYE